MAIDDNTGTVMCQPEEGRIHLQTSDVSEHSKWMECSLLLPPAWAECRSIELTYVAGADVPINVHPALRLEGSWGLRDVFSDHRNQVVGAPQGYVHSFSLSPQFREGLRRVAVHLFFDPAQFRLTLTHLALTGFRPSAPLS